MVEAVLGAAERQDHRVVVQRARELCEVLALVLAPVAPADDEDALQLARLDSVDHLRQNGEGKFKVMLLAKWSASSKLCCNHGW